jgi:hypothetical protein
MGNQNWRLMNGDKQRHLFLIPYEITFVTREAMKSSLPYCLDMMADLDTQKKLKHDDYVCSSPENRLENQCCGSGSCRIRTFFVRIRMFETGSEVTKNDTQINLFVRNT